MEIFKNIFDSLSRERVKYMLAGGVAVNLYGVERATADFDIVVLLEEENLLKFVSAVQGLGMKPKMPVKLEDFVDSKKRQKWITTKGMKVFSLYDPRNPFFLMDVFTEVSFDFNEVYRQRKKIRLEDTLINLVPITILIEMKEGTGRPQDQADVFHLRKIAERLDDGK
jgi:hypothetical protein